MKNRLTLLLLFFGLISAISFSQVIISNNASVFLNNGTLLKGEMRMGLKGLRIKHNSKKFKVYMGKDIDSVHIPQKNGLSRFVYIPLKFNKGKYKDYKLMQPIFEGNKINLYNYSEAVFMSNGFGIYGMSGGNFAFLYAIRNGEKTPTRIGSSYGFHKGFRKVGPEYFNDCQELVSKINNNVYTKENILDALRFYESSCNK